MKTRVPELLMPAGNLSKLQIAFEYGADAAYVGAAGFSMRPDAACFTPGMLADGVKMARKYGKKLYVGLNSLILEGELEEVSAWFKEVEDIDFDAVIVSDPAVFSLVRDLRPQTEIHISTQVSTANSLAAKFWKDAGASRVILARECTLADGQKIVQNSGIEVEAFVHGAMCVAVSGRCLLSSYMVGKSASKGECKHSCRWQYQLVEEKRDGHLFPIFETGKETIVMGSTDLCLIEHIALLVENGYCSLKVEGRMKNEHYMAVVTGVYRAALDAYAKDPDNFTYDPQWREELETVSHRPYETGFAFGYPFTEPGTLQTAGKQLGNRLIMGRIVDKDERTYTIHAKHPFGPGDEIEWIGPGLTGGSVTVVSAMNEHGEFVERTISANDYQCTLETNGQTLPNHAVLRRLKSV